MRRLVFLALASALALSVVALTRGAGTVAPVEVAPFRAVSPPGPPRSPRPVEADAPLRNVFEYGAAPEARTAPAPARRRAFIPPAAPPPSAAEPVRLIGVVDRGGEPRAALVIEGEVVVLSPGESGMGYTLLTVDGDVGATLTTPSGEEVRVPANP